MTAPVAERPVTELVEALRANVAAHPSAVVAYSGGVDSTVVLQVAADVLGDRALGVMGISPSVAPAEVSHARALAETRGLPLLAVDTDEMSDPDYVANPRTRCFHCKQELYGVCRTVAAERGLAVLLNGTNADDTGDWRPGLRAADEAGVRSPLLECGLTKADVRRVAEHLGLPNHDKPALACLASRLPYGTAVTPERLAAVDRVETHLRRLGFREVRARHHGPEVRLEVEAPRVPELERILASGGLEEVVRQAGFSRAAVEPDGYRMGRLNGTAPSAPLDRS